MACSYLCRECTECGKILPLIAFGIRKQGKWGRQSKCLHCKNQKAKKYSYKCKFCGKTFNTRHEGAEYCSRECCAYDKRTSHNDFIKQVREMNPDIEVLDEYINSTTNVRCRCNKHNYEWSANPSSLLRGSGCKYCGAEKISEQKRKTHEAFIQEMKQINPDIKILGEYQGDATNIEVMCLLDNHIWLTSPSNLLQGHGCPVCAIENNRGENNPNYNHDLTQEERLIGRKFTEYYKWREEVYKRDNYTCQHCGSNKGGLLNAHHKDGYHWCKERRTDVSNGVTLCKHCHDEFHNLYGNKHNTEQQYNEWNNTEK